MEIIEEIFKDIDGYEGYYQVSILGRVKSLERYKKGKGNSFIKLKERMLKGCADATGYRNVILCKNGNYKMIKIHHLVWDYFGDRPRNGRKLQVDHIDENPLNNRIENLQLLTQRQNLSKGWKKFNTSSKYTGVSWNKQCKKWRANIKINGKQKHLGSFTNEHDAHIAYQNKLKEIEE